MINNETGKTITKEYSSLAYNFLVFHGFLVELGSCSVVLDVSWYFLVSSTVFVLVFKPKAAFLVFCLI